MSVGQLDLFSLTDEKEENTTKIGTTKGSTTKISEAESQQTTEKSTSAKIETPSNENDETNKPTPPKKRNTRTKKVEVEPIPPSEKEVGVITAEVKTIQLRPFSSVEVGDKVMISQSIDNGVENQAYYDLYKSKKGTVIDIKQIAQPKSHLYQFNVWVQLEKKGEVGIFYDLELEVIV